MDNLWGTLPGKAISSSMSESCPHRSTISCSAITAIALTGGFSHDFLGLLTQPSPRLNMQHSQARSQTSSPVRTEARLNKRVNRRQPCARCAAGGVSGLLQLLPNPAKQKASAASKEIQRLIASGSEDVAVFSQAIDVLLESKLSFQEQSLGGGEWQVTTALGSRLL